MSLHPTENSVWVVTFNDLGSSDPVTVDCVIHADPSLTSADVEALARQLFLDDIRHDEPEMEGVSDDDLVGDNVWWEAVQMRVLKANVTSTTEIAP